ncbi:MAG: hypothetical protein LBG58_13370 [Planctomycetaceae bacterium]|jgi:hypothetical protein|nr:hypothetical protein [Planctomycetaceae bacterium]
MTSYNVTPPNFLDKITLLSTDKAVVTRGFDSGDVPEFRVTDGYYISLFLNYHYLVDRNESEYTIVNKPFLPKPGSYYRYIVEEGKQWDIIDAETAQSLLNSNGVNYSYTAGNVIFPGIIAREIKLKSITPVNNQYDYVVSVIQYIFETPDKSDGEGGEPDSPSQGDPFTISRSTRFIQIAPRFDLSNPPRKLCNSAGQPFEPAIIFELPISVYTINRKEYVNPQQKIDNFIHTINDTAFWGKDPMTVLVEDINATENRQFGTNTKRSWNVTYTLAYNRLTWQSYILDNGMLQIDDEDSEKLTEILDDQNNPVTTPYPLNGAGKKLDKDAVPVYEWTNGSPFVFYYKKDLILLRLPNPYL